MGIARIRIQPHPSGDGVIWRLMAGNNRDLGRTAVRFGNQADCRAAVERLRDGPGELRVELTRGGAAHWGWHILAGDEIAVVASRDYQRRVQAVQAAAMALDLLPGAELEVFP